LTGAADARLDFIVAVIGLFALARSYSVEEGLISIKTTCAMLDTKILLVIGAFVRSCHRFWMGFKPRRKPCVFMVTFAKRFSKPTLGRRTGEPRSRNRSHAWRRGHVANDHLGIPGSRRPQSCSVAVTRLQPGPDAF
jgi:hypothetical protein